jgi:hypothetical protein
MHIVVLRLVLEAVLDVRFEECHVFDTNERLKPVLESAQV